ncbi:MAG: insulinase family protein, partial [Abditibacteriales bacterium]|nr:insulinase family protein [Abditibacteriales bacterium]MDW8368069.1 pitrilysin family protein [Abditibacteriales bacterium]
CLGVGQVANLFYAATFLAWFCAVSARADAPITDGRSIVFRQLPNGLRVVVKEAHASGLVSLWVGVRAGSRYESPQNNGVSHLIEHLVYRGSRRTQPGEVMQIIEDAGGVSNAETEKDYTHYYAIVTSEHFPRVLHALSDAILHPTFDPVELQNEKRAVILELQRHDSNPINIAEDAATSAFFRVHPYRLIAGGTEESVRRLSREALQEFHRKFYVASNMSVVVVGAVKASEALEQVAQAFASASASPPPQMTILPEPPVKGVRRVVRSAPLGQAMISFAFRAPGIVKPEDVWAMDVLMTLLGEGRTSRLYRALQERSPMVTAFETTYLTRRDPGVFLISAIVPDANVEKAQRAILNEIQSVRRDLVSEAELWRAKGVLIGQYLGQTETVDGQAGVLCFYETISDYTDAVNYVDNVRKVTAEQLRRVAQTYLDPESYAVAILRPPARPPSSQDVPRKDARLLERRDAWTYGRMGEGEDGRGDAHTTAETAPPARVKNAPRKTMLPNGMTVITHEDHSSRIVALSAFVKMGAKHETRAGAGIRYFLQAMLMRGTVSRSAQQIENELAAMGASMDVAVGPDYVELWATGGSESTEQLITLLADVLRHPRFDEQEVEKVRQDLLNQIAAEEDAPRLPAQRALNEALFQNEEKEPVGYGLSLIGYEDSIKRIKREDLLNFYRAYYAPNNIVFVVAGDINAAEVMRYITRAFADFPARRVPQVSPPRPAEVPNKPPLIVLEEPRKNALVLVGFRLPPPSHPDYPALRLLATALGEGQSSRLVKTLRDRLGLAYAVGATFSEFADASQLTAFVECSPDSPDMVKNYLLDEVRRLREEPISAQELQRAKNYRLGRFALDHQRNRQRAWHWGVFECWGVGYQFNEEYAEKIRSVTAADVQRVAQKYLERYVVVLVMPSHNRG